jgi:SAM-dependent methyltransferase
VADVPENAVLDRFAEHWGVEIFRGAERDVARRILDCARAHDATTIARALVWWFFLDLDLVRAQVETLEDSDADYVDLPRDFDIRFGADVFRPSFLEKAGDLLAADDGLRRAHELNPWSLAEARPDAFSIQTLTDVPAYDATAFRELRARMRELWPDRWDGAGTPLFPYHVAAKHLELEGGAALDVACGLGAGTVLLAEKGPVTAVDTSEEAIERTRERCGDDVELVHGDALALDLPADRYRVVVSVHTMEHVADDRAFLERIARWLAPGGRLVLEVPLRMRRPFSAVDEPLSPDHVREYDAEGLLALVRERFVVTAAFGVSRGAYVPVERARNAMLIVGTVRSGS